MSQKSKKNSSINGLATTTSTQIATIKNDQQSTRKQHKISKKNLSYYQTTILTYSGFILAFCATVYLTTSYYLIKLSKSLNASEMGAIQFTITMICCLFVALYCKQNILGPKTSRILLIGRGLAGSIALTLNFFSIQLIRYGDSTVIRNTSPVITAIFARIFLKEFLNLSHFLSLIISFSGILFVARPPFIFGRLMNSSSVQIDDAFILGVSLTILSTLAIGSAFIFIKKLTNKEVHFSVIIFYLSAIGCILCLLTSLVLFFAGVSHKQWDSEKEFIYRDIGLGVVAGFVNFLGHICFTLALIRENANTISIMRTMDIVMAFLLEYLVLGIIPDLFSFIGASLVIVSVCVMLIYKIIVNKSAKMGEKKNEEKKDVFRI
jgi:drug/metabolite transporter (DMT)-like permease